MKFKKEIILLLFFTFMNIIKSQMQSSAPVEGEDYPGIKCGKDNPQKEKDCTKYGTDSDMLCCYVENLNDGSKRCTLFYKKRAEDGFKIDPENSFSNGEKWNCGNKSFYLSINTFIILISIFLY